MTSTCPAWTPGFSNLAGPMQHFRSAMLNAWCVARSQLIFAFGKVFRVWLPFEYCGILALHLARPLLRKEIRHCFVVFWLVVFWNGFLLQRVRGELVPFHFCGILMEIGTYFGNVLALLLLENPMVGYLHFLV